MLKIGSEVLSKVGKKTVSNFLKAGAAVGGTLAASALLKSNQEDKTLDYMSYRPDALAAKAFIRKKEELDSLEEIEEFLNNGEEAEVHAQEMQKIQDRVKKLMEIKEHELDSDIGYRSDDEDYDFESNIRFATIIDDKKTLNEQIKKITNPRIKKIIRSLFAERNLYDTTIEILTDIDSTSKSIKKTRIKNLLNKKLDEILPKIKEDDYNEYYLGYDLEGLCNIIDAYNNIKGNYVQYRSFDYSSEGLVSYYKTRTQKFLEAVEAKGPKSTGFFKDELKSKLEENKEVKNSLVLDFLRAQKTENFELIHDKEILEEMYKTYLQELGVPDSIKKRCKKIQEEFGVTILLSSYSRNLKSEIDYIYKELSAWRKASNGEAKLPKVLNLERANADFLYNVDGSNSGYSGVVRIDGGLLGKVKETIRHEIMHSNDIYRIKFSINDDEVIKLINEIMPTINIDGEKERDWENCKYREEFLNAGVDPDHIDYAYTNRQEFIAVAAEGDMSAYSPEFKEVLIKLGMPEWVFNLEINNYNIISNRETVKKVREENPEVTDFDELVELVHEELLEEKEAEFLLRFLFGSGKF